MDNRKILFVGPSAYPLGGVATWLDYLLPGLEEKGWIPTLGLVSGKFHDPDQYLSSHPFHCVVRIENPTGSQEGRVRALCKVIQHVGPDIVLSVNIPDVYLAMARLRSQDKSNARCVMTLHGIQSDLLGDANAFCNMLDAVISTNRLTCKLLHDVAEVPFERIHYAPYGVPISQDKPASLRKRDAGAPMRIAWVGRLEEDQKRVSDICLILRELDSLNESYELWLVGSGPEERRLRHELEPWVARGKIKYFGELSRDAVFAEVFSKADVFLLTSSWETGPLVVWEAMSAGLPVITSEYLGSGPEGSLINGENCLMFPVGDVEQAAKQIALLNDSLLYDKLNSAGMALVSARYSIETSVSQWCEVLEEIMQKARIELSNGVVQIESRGRLDRWLGVGAAETLRYALGIHYTHTEPGGEWPHTISGKYLETI